MPNFEGAILATPSIKVSWAAQLIAPRPMDVVHDVSKLQTWGVGGASKSLEGDRWVGVYTTARLYIQAV